MLAVLWHGLLLNWHARSHDSHEHFVGVFSQQQLPALYTSNLYMLLQCAVCVR